jgi:DNA-binding MarR family transcriptional regulator
MDDTIDFSECQHCACLTARTEAQRLTRMFDERLRPHGLTINQFSMLATLILAGPVPVSRLAERLGIDRTTMTRNLAVAEQRGLLKTMPGKDARERLIQITPAGRELAAKAFPAWQAAQRSVKNS